MNNNFLHKIFAIVFSFLIVFSGMAFIINKHICTKNNIVNSIQTTPSCCKNEEESSCDISHSEKNCCGETTPEKTVKSYGCEDYTHCSSDCCINTNLRLQVLTTEKVISEKIIIKKAQVEQVNYSFVQTLFYTGAKKDKFISFYSPPHFKKNLNILFQVFRI